MNVDFALKRLNRSNHLCTLGLEAHSILQFELLADFYRTAIDANQFKQLADQYYLLTVVPSTGNNGFIYDKTYQLPLETLNKKRQCSGYFSAAHHICHSRMQTWLDREEEAD